MFFGTNSHYTILSNCLTIFKVDAEMSEIFTDFSREKSQKNLLPIDFNGSEIIDIVVLGRN